MVLERGKEEVDGSRNNWKRGRHKGRKREDMIASGIGKMASGKKEEERKVQAKESTMFFFTQLGERRTQEIAV